MPIFFAQVELDSVQEYGAQSGEVLALHQQVRCLFDSQNNSYLAACTHIYTGIIEPKQAPARSDPIVHTAWQY